MSPKPPASKPPKPPCPAPVPAPGRPPEPKKIPPRSYCLRLSASPTMSYADWISLKRSSAFASSGLRSGWYWRASLRYAFLMSSCDALRSTPRTEYGSRWAIRALSYAATTTFAGRNTSSR